MRRGKKTSIFALLFLRRRRTTSSSSSSPSSFLRFSLALFAHSFFLPLKQTNHAQNSSSASRTSRRPPGAASPESTAERPTAEASPAPSSSPPATAPRCSPSRRSGGRSTASPSPSWTSWAPPPPSWSPGTGGASRVSVGPLAGTRGSRLPAAASPRPSRGTGSLFYRRRRFCGPFPSGTSPT